MVTSAANSARFPPLGLMHLGICRLWKTKESEPLREEVPSVSTIGVAGFSRAVDAWVS